MSDQEGFYAAGISEPGISQPGINVTMLLCDHVTVAEGKFYINGGGWSVTGPNPTPMGIALLIGVPWSSAGSDVHFRLQLVLTDGHPGLLALLHFSSLLGDAIGKDPCPLTY